MCMKTKDKYHLRVATHVYDKDHIVSLVNLLR